MIIIYYGYRDYIIIATGDFVSLGTGGSLSIIY